MSEPTAFSTNDDSLFYADSRIAFLHRENAQYDCVSATAGGEPLISGHSSIFLLLWADRDTKNSARVAMALRTGLANGAYKHEMQGGPGPTYMSSFPVTDEGADM